MARQPKLLLGKILTIGGPVVEELIGQIPVGSITGLLYSTLPEPLKSRLVLDSRIYDVPSFDEKLYLIARIALESRVAGIISVVPGALLVLQSEIEQKSDQLINEIRHGKLAKLSTISKELEHDLLCTLRPNRQRADELLRLKRRHGRLHLNRVWPLQALCTYVAEIEPPQMMKLREMCGDLTIIDPGIVASEGRISIGMQSGASDSAVIPSASFLEFIPRECLDTESIPASQKTVLPNELVVGSEYVPVTTNRNGFLRYIIGDLVRVTKIERGIPFIEFMGRIDSSISVAGEKVTEVQAREAVRRVESELQCSFDAWAIGIDWAGHWPRYVFAYESLREIQNIATTFERALCTLNVSYRRKKEQKLLAPLVAYNFDSDSIARVSKRPRWFGQVKPRHLFSGHESEFKLLLATK